VARSSSAVSCCISGLDDDVTLSRNYRHIRCVIRKLTALDKHSSRHILLPDDDDDDSLRGAMLVLQTACLATVTTTEATWARSPQLHNETDCTNRLAQRSNHQHQLPMPPIGCLTTSPSTTSIDRTAIIMQLHHHTWQPHLSSHFALICYYIITNYLLLLINYCY